MDDHIKERAERVGRLALSPREAAQALGISRPRILKAIAEGRITPPLIGNASRILVTDLVDWYRTWPQTYRRS